MIIRAGSYLPVRRRNGVTSGRQPSVPAARNYRSQPRAEYRAASRLGHGWPPIRRGAFFAPPQSSRLRPLRAPGCPARTDAPPGMSVPRLGAPLRADLRWGAAPARRMGPSGREAGARAPSAQLIPRRGGCLAVAAMPGMFRVPGDETILNRRWPTATADPA
jgi:hypothetical protein